MNLLYDVWDETVTPDAIKNCWAKATFFPHQSVQPANNNNTDEQERSAYFNILILASKVPSADKETAESKLSVELNDQVKELQETIKACNNETDMKDIFLIGKMKRNQYPSRIYF